MSAPNGRSRQRGLDPCSRSGGGGGLSGWCGVLGTRCVLAARGTRARLPACGRAAAARRNCRPTRSRSGGRRRSRGGSRSAPTGCCATAPSSRRPGSPRRRRTPTRR
eukprot:3814303-Prymnesium_polylepis.1